MAEVPVSITPLLKNQAFDPDLIRAIDAAFQKACRQLRLSASSDVAAEVVAGKLFRIAQTGERDPDRLAQRALAEFDLPTDDGADGA